MKKYLAFMIMALSLQSAFAESFPKMGVIVPQELLAKGQVVARLINYSKEGQVLIESVKLNAATATETQKYIAPYSHSSETGVMFEGVGLFSKVNYVQFCVLNKAGNIISVSQTNLSGCFDLFGNDAIKVMEKQGYSQPLSEYLKLSLSRENPAISITTQN